jgi:hypothetical protein
MQWPTLIVDDFFTDPYAIVKLSTTFKYARATDGRWPGTRSPPMHEVDDDFFLWSTRKIMAVLYPMNINGVRWLASQHFQRVPHKIYGDEGWVHADSDYEITTIVYLSHHSQSGTCLYEGTHFNIQPEHKEEKERFNLDLKDRKRMEKYKDKNNSKFRKKFELFSNFNRLVLFDGSNWHASKNSGADMSDRLTLITHFKDITCKDIRYPITQMRRI